MVSKNNKKLIAEKNRRNEKQRFAIRKLNIGVASVLLGITFSIYGGGQAVAHADTANASDQVATSNTGDNSLADKSAVALSSAAANASQSSTSATSANSAVQSQASANSQPAATASNNAPASTAAVEATKDQSTSENQSSTSQEVQTPAPAQPVGQENSSKDANASASLDATRQVLNTITNRSSIPGANYLMLFAESKVATPAPAAKAEDPNAVTVSDEKGFINAIQNGTATTINVAKDLNLAKQTDSKYTEINIKNKRDIVIQSDNPEEKRTIDFSGYSFDMNTENSVTFKDLNIYARSYWGLVYNAGGYTFNNVNFTGSQLIYTKPSINSTLTFKNNITANSVSSYVGPLDGKTRDTQQNGGQQILQFEGGTNQIIFDENSNVTLTTEDANALEIDGGTTTIDVKDGANVAINPHSKGNPESRNGIGTGYVARAIAANAKMTINIDPNSTLTINTEKVDGDKDVAGALYLNSDAALNVNGKLVINSNGTPSANKSNGVPVYINGSAKINVGNGGSFSLDATNLGNYSSSLISINGTGTVKLDPHSSFKISGDGTGAVTAINLSSGSTFTSDQPDAFTIDLSANTSTGKSLIKNGTIKFKRVKTVATDGTISEPLGKIDVTYDKNGNATSYTITAQDENTVKQVGEGLANKNLIDLVKAGEDVTLSNLHLSKNNVLTGTVASSGSNNPIYNPIYVTVTVGDKSTNVPVAGNYTVYTNTNGTVTSDTVDYAAQTGSTGGNFSIDLSKLASSLTDDANVTVTATKDFVEAAQTESVAALRALNTTTLQELVDAAPAEEAKPSYYNATAEAQKAYNNAIATGKNILANPNNYDQVDVDDAVTAIQNAQNALTGKETDKTALQTAVDQASSVESSDNYTNADTKLQDNYQAAIKAGQDILSNDNATQTEVDNALTTINNAKDALNGDAKKAASKEALQKAVDEAPTVKSDDAAYYNGSDEAKTAYDKAVSAGQTVLADPDATATQITDALNAINTAKGNLKGEATNKSVLQKVVDYSATVKDSNNYTNADQANQEALNNAITAGQKILKNTNATQAEVDNAVKAITDAINGLNGDTNLANAKNVATEDIQKALNTKTTEITDATNIDQATKDQLIADAKKAAEDANTAINQATNADAVNTAKTEGITNINNVTVPSLDDAKTNAAKEIDQALTDKTKEINNAENIDQTTKAQLIKEATDAATTAKDAIEKSTTNDEATKAGQAGVDAINNVKVPSVIDSQNAAKDVINDALNSKTKEINEATNIDQTTKDQLIKEATDAANNAKEDIDKATTADAIKTAQDEGTTNINNVTVPSLEDAKKAANKAVDDALTAQTEVINKADNLSDAEKKDLIDQATTEANKAKDNIETATTNNEAAQAGQDGVDAIKKVVPTSLDTVKSDADKAIDDALTKKLKEINSASDLTTDEKTALIQEANTAADKAKEDITKATTNDAVIEAQNNGVTAIDGIKVPTESAVKEAAKKAVAEAAEAKNNAINASNLTDEEKAALKQKVTDAQNAADQAIDNATTNAAVTAAQTNGVTTIDDIKVPTESAVKEAAKQAVADAATAKNKAIDASNLTAEEKADLKQKVTDAQNAADQAIDNATTNAAVTAVQTNGVTTIDDIKVPTTSATKEQAITDLNTAVDDAKKAIDQDSNLTDEQKQAAKDQIDSDAKTAQDAINNAKTNDGVKKAADAGTLAIDKDVANAAIDNAVAGKKAEISNSSLTDEEKTTLNNEVDQKAQDAKKAINAATTPEAVTSAQENGIKNINETSVPTQSAAKEAAKKAVAEAAEAKNNAIDSSNLTDEEKSYLEAKSY